MGNGLSSIEKSLIPWYQNLWKMVAYRVSLPIIDDWPSWANHSQIRSEYFHSNDLSDWLVEQKKG